jgi:uncharacterized membrane protein (Fun14 family)
MSTSSPDTPTAADRSRPESRSFGSWLAAMPTWKKVAVAAAVLTAVAGLALGAASDAPPVSPSGGSYGNLSAGMVEGTGPSGTGTATGVASAEEPPAKGVFRLGFSFLAGFCLGSFLRATLKLAAIAFGFWLALTMVLNYYGILTVDWHAMNTLWDRFAANVEQEWGNAQRFLTGSLPAAGLATTGLVIGLKRH